MQVDDNQLVPRGWGADLKSMNRSTWTKVPVKKLLAVSLGRTEKAWRHRCTNALLLLHHPRSRNGQWARRIGVWCVVLGGTLVRRRAAYGRLCRGVPWRWADRTLRDYRMPHAGQTCTLINGQRPTVATSIMAMPVHYDELPAVLMRHNKHGNQAKVLAADEDPVVPTALPTVPPQRTLTGRHAQKVLSREEYNLYVQTWREWLTAHPEYNTAEGRHMLAELCITEVRMHRLMLHQRHQQTSQVGRMYHATFLHMNRIRQRLGATRRQRLAVSLLCM